MYSRSLGPGTLAALILAAPFATVQTAAAQGLRLPRAVVAQGSRPAVTIEPQFFKGEFLPEAPQLTEEQRQARELWLQILGEIRRNQSQVAVNPNARPEFVRPARPTWAGNSPASVDPADFALYRTTLLTDVFTQNQTSSTNEPSLGMNCETVFYSGNWNATVSADGGRNFTYVNPYPFFPAYNGGFCCDQLVYYEPSRGLMFWYLQYVADGAGNTVVLAVSTSNAITTASPTINLWFWYPITPQLLGYAAGVWFDFPDVTASGNFLYITTNIIGAGDNAIVFKLDLDDLANANTVTLNNFTSSLPNLRATHGATDTMYVGTQVNNDTLRIYSWPEANASPASMDRGVDAWFTATSTAPSPDGTDWIAFDFHDILAAWVGDGVVGFMWDSAQGGAFPWPQVRYARFAEAGLGLLDQGQIWNPNYAWGYPSVHPNDNGDVGGTMAVGGGGNAIPYPSFVAWIADDFNADTIAPLENLVIASGNAGPASDRWGDYLTTRRNEPFGETWSASGFVLNGGQTGGFAEPYFVWFGREEDTPPPPSIGCPEDITVECTETGGTPTDDAQLAGFFGGAAATDACDPSVDITDDAPALLNLGPTVVTFTAENDSGFFSQCTATISVVDTTPPEITCPGDVTVTCGDSTDPSATGMAMATDICDPAPLIEFEDVEISATCLADPVMFSIERTWTATDGSANATSCVQTITVLKVVTGLDIKPGSCPNPFSRNAQGFLPVGLLGTNGIARPVRTFTEHTKRAYRYVDLHDAGKAAHGFDVTMVDLSTIRISRGDCVGGTVAPNQGPQGPRVRFADVGTPYGGPLCGCHELEGDGVTDLAMKFSRSEMTTVLDLDGLAVGDEVEIVVTGTLADGCEFVARDCIRIVH